MSDLQIAIDMVLPRIDEIERVEIRTVSYDDDYTGGSGKSVCRVCTGVVLYFQNGAMVAVVPSSLTTLTELIYWFHHQLSARESTRQELRDMRRENAPTLYVGRHRVVV